VVALRSEPPADILLGGKKVGTTPKELRLAAGAHVVTLVADAGKLQKTVKLTVKAGARTEENVVLSPTTAPASPSPPPAKTPPRPPEPSPGPGPGGDSATPDAAEAAAPAAGAATLVLTVKPWADVYLDGIKVGTTPLPPLPIAPGNHIIDLDNPELGKTKRLPIKAKPGKPVKLKVDLTK
jgi:serine/threonine-protein kinase